MKKTITKNKKIDHIPKNSTKFTGEINGFSFIVSINGDYKPNISYQINHNNVPIETNSFPDIEVWNRLLEFETNKLNTLKNLKDMVHSINKSLSR